MTNHSLATAITTATLSTEDIQNKADYHSMSGGVSYSHSTVEEKKKDNGVKPDIGMLQEVEKSSTTHTAIADNTLIHITDKTKQSQNIDSISRDTEHASYAMTEINTEVLDIRGDLAQDVAKDGFEKVDDIAMNFRIR